MSLFPSTLTSKATLEENEQVMKRTLHVALEQVVTPLISRDLFTGGEPLKNKNHDHNDHWISECGCTVVMLYLKALSDRRLWPLTDAFETLPVNGLLSRLEQCSFSKRNSETNCKTCQ